MNIDDMVHYVVVGGGVAGVCCAEELCRLCPADRVTLVSADRVLKGISTVARLTRLLEEVKVEDKVLDELPYANLAHMQDVATGIDLQGKRLLLASHDPLPYDKLCVCAGARPKELAVPPDVAASGRVLTLRDTGSVERLAAALGSARRVVVAGNGGIAMQCIHGLRGVEVVWAMKHGHIGDAFFDLDAAQFLLEELLSQRQAERHAARQAGDEQQQQGSQEGGGAAGGAACGAGQQAPQGPPAGGGEQRWPRADAGAAAGRPAAASAGLAGHAVGPFWLRQLPQGAAAGGSGDITLDYGCEVAAVELLQPQGSASEAAAAGAGGVAGAERPWPLRVALTNGRAVGADLLVCAIGVTPALDWVPPALARAPDGGLRVNRRMQTGDPSVYAAGDSCSAAWALAESPHWLQMRLWSQARSMGLYAAACMAGREEDSPASMAFEMFTHVTRFLGRKVVLLGLYNGQRLENEPAEDMVSYSRITEGDAPSHGGCCRPGPVRAAVAEGGGRTFVRVLLLRGRMQGAVLIGETDLEETFENLILDQLDVGVYGPALLDPEVELDHVFD